MAWDCDSIEWLVDILGTIGLLEAVGDCKVYDVSQRGPQRSAFSGRTAPDGLYFDGAHWYSVKGSVTRDSYSSKFQISGTAHFCQTFALMIHLGLDGDLVDGDYKGNVKKAVDFWIKFFTDQPDFAKWVCDDQIKKSQWTKVIPESQTTSLASITPTRWINFLKAVSNNAGVFASCKQG